MMNFNRVASVAAFSVILPFALVACSESNPTSLEEPVADLEPVPESSAELSSGSECQGIVIPEGFLCLQEVCNAENEGRVIAAKHGNPKYGYQVSYAQCKQGSWTNVEPWVACDTVGVAVGDTCSEATSKGGFQFGGNSHAYYIYAGDGVWKEIEPVSVDSSESTTLELGKCSSENEGRVETKYYQEGTSMMDTRGNHEYFRCEQGTWIRRGEWVKCGTDGVQVGDLCDLTSNDGVSIRSPYSYSTLYEYVGGGIWNEFNPCDGDSSGECNSVKKIDVVTENGRVTKYYKFETESWSEISDFDYNCATSSTVLSEDTCVFERDGETQAYLLTWNNYLSNPREWEKIDYDPVLGYCSRFDYQKYGVRDEKIYSCEDGKWIETDVIPRQYTDSRKEGLSDDEYDVLDLPKEASVGNIAGGLLEVCYSKDVRICVPQRYYRYDENGSWKLHVSYRHIEDEGWDLYAYYRYDESGLWLLNASYQCKGEKCGVFTDEEMSQDDENSPCTPENEGAEIVILPKVYMYPKRNSLCYGFCMDARSQFERGAIYQCASGKKVFKDYAFERIE